jgi:hypothetical protein
MRFLQATQVVVANLGRLFGQTKSVQQGLRLRESTAETLALAHELHHGELLLEAIGQRSQFRRCFGLFSAVCNRGRQRGGLVQEQLLITASKTLPAH